MLSCYVQRQECVQASSVGLAKHENITKYHNKLIKEVLHMPSEARYESTRNNSTLSQNMCAREGHVEDFVDLTSRSEASSVMCFQHSVRVTVLSRGSWRRVSDRLHAAKRDGPQKDKDLEYDYCGGTEWNRFGCWQ
jgi:hypothetical protein